MDEQEQHVEEQQPAALDPSKFTIIESPSDDILAGDVEPVINLEDYKTCDDMINEEEHEEEQNIEAMLAETPNRHIRSSLDDNDDSDNFLEVIYLPEETVKEEEISDELFMEESVTKLDRKIHYYNVYNICMQTGELKLRNEILHMKMVEYFKKRNMYFMFKEVPSSSVQSLKRKYRDTLYKMSDIKQILAEQKKNIIDELQYLQEKKDTVFKEVTKIFSSSQNRLRDIGIGLIFTKSGHILTDKNVEWLLRRKEYVTKELIMLRMIFIKLRNRTNEKEKLIRDIEKICGEHLTLSRYLELKRLNRRRGEKIETIDTDLSKLRHNVKLTIQTLAHFSEKNDGLRLEIHHGKLLMRALHLYTDSHREITSKLKKSRDYYRREYHNVTRKSGLLLYPTLLEDMVEANTEVSNLHKEVTKLEQENKQKSQNLRNLRKNMELLATGQYDAVGLSETEIQKARERQLKIRHSKTKVVTDKKKKVVLPKIN